MTEGNTLAPRASASTSRLGQGTAIEQTRANAQVQMAMWAAQERPRNTLAVRVEMRAECGQMRLAEQAFYSYKQAGQTVTGPTVHLARELARIFGNFDFGFFELRRDDDFGQSEMLAFAWDLEKNVRNSTVVVSPHRRGGTDSKVLTDPQQINQNNANIGARRLREAIFAVLPRSFVDEAQDLCRQTLEGGGGKPLADRIEQAVETFVKLKVNVAQMEQRIGRRIGEWNGVDLANLSILYRSISRGETTAAEQFAEAPVTSAEGAAASKAAAQAGAAVSSSPAQGLRPYGTTDLTREVLSEELGTGSVDTTDGGGEQGSVVSQGVGGSHTEGFALLMEELYAAREPEEIGQVLANADRQHGEQRIATSELATLQRIGDLIATQAMPEDRSDLWELIKAAAPGDWDGYRVSTEFESGAGLPVSEAAIGQLQGFLKHLRDLPASAAAS